MAGTGPALKEFFLNPWRSGQPRREQGCVVCKTAPPEVVDVNDENYWEEFHCKCEWDNSPEMWSRLPKSARSDVVTCMLVAKRAGVPRDVARLLSLRVGQGSVPPMTYDRMRSQLTTSEVVAEVAHATGLLPLLAQFLGALLATVVMAKLGNPVQYFVATVESDANPWTILCGPILGAIVAAMIVWLSSFLLWRSP